MSESLRIALPSQGWRQILTARKEILDAYDRARQQARAQEVETFHGSALEAAIRKWLSDFLPKRYGVARGYIVSAGYSHTVRVPHFDVIIYDQLEAPVLWVEHTPDTSGQGRSLAIPVEHVNGVLEVKSAFTAASVKKAIEHLHDLGPLLRGTDAPDERYKVHLSPKFFCGFVCGELRKGEEYSETALASCIQGVGLRGFVGGLILRGEGHTLEHTGRVSITSSEQPIESTVKNRRTPLWEFGMSDSVRISEKMHIGTMLSWSEMDFARFAFDLVAMLQGTYEAGRLSSFYGIGGTWHEMTQDAQVGDNHGQRHR